MNIKPEVLSPAGSRETLEAAVRSGADAVYLGATKFSARRNAANFDDGELSETVEYCHIRGVKVYLALNIMLKDEELPEAVKLLETAYYAGVDGVIIEDLGLVRIARQRFSDLPLHASTQMTVTSPAALPILKELGFSRVVLAREMSREQIGEFCEKAKEYGIEVEVFVHGALCMCVSGQCLLSSVLGARSGNRGLCAGPCRLPFSVSGGTGYDLSLKDLSLVRYIGELRRMGVASLKIEGRMKRPEYVAAATAACRQAVDTGNATDEIMAPLRNVFSRSGFTDGYYTSRLTGQMFGTRTKEDVQAAKDAFSELHTLYRNERQSVKIDIKAVFKSGKPSEITLSDGNYTVTVNGGEPSVALKNPADEQTVKAALSKLGGTPYFADKVEVTLDGGLFLSNAFLNSLRRNAIEKLSAVRGKTERKNVVETALDAEIPEPKAKMPSGGKGETKIYAGFLSAEQIPNDLSGVSTVVLPLECAAATPAIIPLECAAEIPRIYENEADILKKLAQAKENGYTYALCHTLAAIELAKSVKMPVIGGIGLNVLNGETVKELESIGVSEVTVSAEADIFDAAGMSLPLKKGIFAYGRLPLMTFKNCPVKNGEGCASCKKQGEISDRLNKKFPVSCKSGNPQLFNGEILWLADRLADTNGFDFLFLYFTDETASQADGIIKAYKNGKNPPESFTRGLYYRKLS